MVAVGRAGTGRGRCAVRRAPELVASMRQPCPWREVEVAELRPKAPGRRGGEDVGFLSPCHCPGCEQAEAAAYPGRPHPEGAINKPRAGLLRGPRRPGTTFPDRPCDGRVQGRGEQGSRTTPSAVNKIKQLLKDKPEHVGVKVGVRTRGCNGLSYTLEYTKKKGDSDEEVVQDGSRRLYMTHVLFSPRSESIH
ncbi:iron-sulfur cluster assembly 1 homolog, mitochondrial isoform X2 [Nycticebus coucang]|uniref:iron-sulfur cluster assembly 1 homolog, mitochondrial isoform X2 n=1 Tax=Nycticebus coucang TaxID=9470 RepID=UPI00234D0049|nr:iron-sulfur cluster assembly 1 homolog, mitochondrial isoform X2 [Nycticebus coucang]